MQDLEFLITYIADKKGISVAVPETVEECTRLYFSLAEDFCANEEEDEFFLQVEDRFLSSLIKAKGVVSQSELQKIGGFYICKCDPTRLGVDAVIDCTDEYLTGYYSPCNSCVEGRINSYAGVLMHSSRNAVEKFAAESDEDASALITLGYNLPAKYVIHPIDKFKRIDYLMSSDEQFSNTLRSRLHLAWMNKVATVALCCSFCYSPEAEKAAEDFVLAVKDWLSDNPDYKFKIVVNVFTDEDRVLIEKVLSK